MKHKLLGIYGKIFFYTVLILVFVIFVMFAFFSDQINAVVEFTQRQQVTDVFQPLFDQLNGKSDDEMIEITNSFHMKNTSFEFCLETLEGQVLYQTDNFQINTEILPDIVIMKKKNSTPMVDFNSFIQKGTEDRFKFITLVNGRVKLLVAGITTGSSVYQEFITRMIFAFALILITSILAAALFASRITNPIKKIAGDIKKMSDLEQVAEPVVGKDEIGLLANDVYKMYKTLLLTIQQYENEIEKEREMEENQRYFFSAASHELKTPIAATNALLEGMLEHVIEPEQYPAYLKKCLKMMNEQSKLITEILDIVSLNNNAKVQERERINLYRCVKSVLSASGEIADGKGQHIEIDIPQELYCTVNLGLFQKACSNIVINAIQNTRVGGRVQIYTIEKGKGARLCILNEDARIPEETLHKLFEPFYREDKSRSPGLGRNGLGLTIVNKTLNLMGVPFSLENVDKGVLFWMDLPY